MRAPFESWKRRQPADSHCLAIGIPLLAVGGYALGAALTVLNWGSLEAALQNSTSYRALVLSFVLPTVMLAFADDRPQFLQRAFAGCALSIAFLFAVDALLVDPQPPWEATDPMDPLCQLGLPTEAVPLDFSFWAYRVEVQVPLALLALFCGWPWMRLRAARSTSFGAAARLEAERRTKSEQPPSGTAR